MRAENAINTNLVPLTVDDSVLDARSKMDEVRSDIYPVVTPEDQTLVGQVRRSDIEDLDPATRISMLKLEDPVKIFDIQHLFEAARLMLQYELRLVTVVDQDMKFVGMIQKQRVLESLTGLLNLAAYGSVITIELDRRDFTLSEIVQLIETEGAKILGITVETPENEEGIFKVSIKINLQDTTRVTSALRRYDYEVTTESSPEMYGFDLESRADELIKYLDM